MNQMKLNQLKTLNDCQNQRKKKCKLYFGKFAFGCQSCYKFSILLIAQSASLAAISRVGLIDSTSPAR